MRAKDQARHKWHEILSRCGIDKSFLKNQHGPCPICGGNDRFRFDNKNGSGSFFCTACGSGEGFTLLMKMNNWSYAEAAKTVELCLNAFDIKPQVTQEMKDEASLRNKMVDLWRQSRPITESPDALAYLQSRRISYDNPQVMRCIIDPETTVILCKITGPNGKGCQIHRTYLKKGGIKSDRKLMSGTLPAGSAIRLFDPLEDWLGVAEGVETALSAQQQFGVPTWSLLNANNLMAFNPPDKIKRLSIFGDNDASYTGQAAAYHLAHRLKKTGLQIAVLIPGHVDTDWNDYPLKKHF